MNACSIRSQIYSGFAQAFTYPEEDMEESLVSGEVESELRKIASELPYSCKLNQAQPQNDARGHLSADASLSVLYSSTFEVGNAAVPLHEGSYSTQNHHKMLEDIFRFYEHFGLDFKDKKLDNTPDWLISELEFVHYLSFLESTCDDENKVRALARAQHDFLDKHLSKWLGGLVEKFKTQDIAIYGDLSELLCDFVLNDKKYLAALEQA